MKPCFEYLIRHNLIKNKIKYPYNFCVESKSHSLVFAVFSNENSKEYLIKEYDLKNREPNGLLPNCSIMATDSDPLSLIVEKYKDQKFEFIGLNRLENIQQENLLDNYPSFLEEYMNPKKSQTIKEIWLWNKFVDLFDLKTMKIDWQNLLSFYRIKTELKHNINHLMYVDFFKYQVWSIYWKHHLLDHEEKQEILPESIFSSYFFS